MLQNPCKTLGFIKNMVYKIPPGGGGKPYPASGLYVHCRICTKYLEPSINGLVTDGNTKLCCRGFVSVLFQSTAAYKIDSEHTQDYTKLFPVCKLEILQVTVNIIEVLSCFLVDF